MFIKLDGNNTLVKCYVYEFFDTPRFAPHLLVRQLKEWLVSTRPSELVECVWRDGQRKLQMSAIGLMGVFFAKC